MTDTNAQASTVNEKVVAETAATETSATTATTAVSASAPAADAQAADAGKEPTLLGGEVAEKPVAAPADFPTDWREKMAGEDKKALEQLKRYNSPVDLWNKARSLEQKLSSGEYKRETPKPEKPEELKAWLAERGIPETPDGYKIELKDGVVLGEADKPLVDSFTKAAHGLNWDNAKVNEALNWYYAEQERMLAERAEADHQFRLQAEDELRAEYGQEFRQNMTAVKNLLAGMPEGEAEALLMGRMADGRRIGDNPKVIRFLANLANELNPAATLLPATSGDPGKGVADRLAEIRKFRAENPDKYDQDKKMQNEELELLSAQEKLQARGRAA